jgi:hypothetical protein
MFVANCASLRDAAGGGFNRPHRVQQHHYWKLTMDIPRHMQHSVLYAKTGGEMFNRLIERLISGMRNFNPPVI